MRGSVNVKIPSSRAKLTTGQRKMENDNGKYKIMKKKRYWLRTGFVLATTLLAYNLFLGWLNHVDTYISSELYRVYEINYPFAFTGFLVTGFDNSFTSTLLGTVFAFIVFFLIGSLIGLLYGKVKHRNFLSHKS